MNLDTETEEGRANWQMFRTLAVSKMYQSATVPVYVMQAAQALGIDDGIAIHRMSEAVYASGERLAKIVAPFVEKAKK